MLFCFALAFSALLGSSSSKGYGKQEQVSKQEKIAPYLIGTYMHACAYGINIPSHNMCTYTYTYTHTQTYLHLHMPMHTCWLTLPYQARPCTTLPYRTALPTLIPCQTIRPSIPTSNRTYIHAYYIHSDRDGLRTHGMQTQTDKHTERPTDRQIDARTPHTQKHRVAVPSIEDGFMAHGFGLTREFVMPGVSR